MRRRERNTNPRIVVRENKKSRKRGNGGDGGKNGSVLQLLLL